MTADWRMDRFLLVDQPEVQRLSDLPRAKRLSFLSDMDQLGAAVEAACRRLDSAFRRVNLEILGNTDPFLHVRDVLRDAIGSELDRLRSGI